MFRFYQRRTASISGSALLISRGDFFAESDRLARVAGGGGGSSVIDTAVDTEMYSEDDGTRRTSSKVESDHYEIHDRDRGF